MFFPSGKTYRTARMSPPGYPPAGQTSTPSIRLAKRRCACAMALAQMVTPIRDRQHPGVYAHPSRIRVERQLPAGMTRMIRSDDYHQLGTRTRRYR